MWSDLARDYAALAAAILLTAYLLPALLFQPALLRALGFPRIQPRRPLPGQVRREVLESLRAVLLFAAYALPVLWAYRAGATALHGDWGATPWWSVPLALAAAAVLHDTWFYWTHRLMHWRRLYPWVHAGHHRSVTPTPWATLNFQPLETLPQFGIFALLAFCLPVHWAVLWAYVLFDSLVNAAGHCGHEVIPAWQGRHPVLRYANAVTHHDLHHQNYRWNYAQYFNIWDRCCGTFRDR